MEDDKARNFRICDVESSIPKHFMLSRSKHDLPFQPSVKGETREIGERCGFAPWQINGYLNIKNR